MRIGYSYWGFLGDYKEDKDGNALSTPDGNAAYGWSLLWEIQRRGHNLFLMQDDRDWPVFQRRGKNDFASFSTHKRMAGYLLACRTIGEFACFEAPFPKLDILLLEWRFPIPGRNTPQDRGSPNYQPDLERQNELIEYYKDKGTKIIIWDMDHKLTAEDEDRINPHAILETSWAPRQLLKPRVRVEPPVVFDDLLQHPPKAQDPNRKLVYVGSRYERDDVIEEWIKPVSERFPDQVEFWGNWTREDNFPVVKAKWPNIKYCDRISMKDFDKAYGTAVAVPLLAKKGYLETGFITPRIWEALLFGSIPVGLASHAGLTEYLPAHLIALNPDHLGTILEWLAQMPLEERDELRRNIVQKIRFMDVGNFVDTLEKM
jgi:hypothetical protein